LSGAQDIMNRLEVVLETYLPAQIAAVATRTGEVVPAIAKVYQEEYDFQQLDVLPAIVLFEDDPVITGRSSGLIMYAVPITIMCWDICQPSGFADLHRRLKRWREAVVTCLLDRPTETVWEGSSLASFLSSPPLSMAGWYGRARGVRWTFNTSEYY
jgi:hypothetical protein